VEVVEAVPEEVVHEDNDWGISLVDEDLGDAGLIPTLRPVIVGSEKCYDNVKYQYAVFRIRIH